MTACLASNLSPNLSWKTKGRGRETAEMNERVNEPNIIMDVCMCLFMLLSEDPC